MASEQLLSSIAKLIFGVIFRICLALLVIGFIDLLYRKWKYIEQLKMSKQEIKYEHRDTEGPPELKAKIRQKQFETAVRRMLQDVPKANVVLVNPDHVAVALQYGVAGDAGSDDLDLPMRKNLLHPEFQKLVEGLSEADSVPEEYGVPQAYDPEFSGCLFRRYLVIPEAQRVGLNPGAGVGADGVGSQSPQAVIVFDQQTGFSHPAHFFRGSRFA